jgi:protein-ribulosamine 3-kinase
MSANGQLPDPLTDQLETLLSDHAERPVKIHELGTVPAGSLHDTHLVCTDHGTYFLKTNPVDRSPSYFGAEARGLGLIASTSTIRTPAIIGHGELSGTGFLLLEFVEQRAETTAFWRRFGTELAALHRHSNAHFGLDHDNYIGTLVQSNRAHDLWHTFLIEERFGPQLKLARDRKRVEAGLLLRFERLFNRLEQLIPKEPPALLHGDLWHGNILCATGEEPVLIDPAVHYGHREMDIAMARLFGGFDQAFFDAYREAWPLSDGWEERLELHSLYPLLVHGNLFGGTYFEQVDRMLRKFV